MNLLSCTSESTTAQHRVRHAYWRAAAAAAHGDEAPEGTPGTAENTCPRCAGTGRLDGSPCPDCLGTGVVIVNVGDA